MIQLSEPNKPAASRFVEKSPYIRRFFRLDFLEKGASLPLRDHTSGRAHLDSTGSRRKNRARRFRAGESKSAWQAGFYALKRCGKDRTGPNKMPAQGAWPTA